MADEVDQFIAALYQRAKQEGEDPHDVADRIYQNARGVSRRELLQGGGALGVGALLGGGGAMAATGQASASDHTDSEGNVGLPNDRVDGFFDTADANLVSPDKIQSVEVPDSGEDLAQYDSDGTLILLTEGSYDLSAPITASNGFAIYGMGDREDYRITYTGGTGSGSIGFLDWSDPTVTTRGCHIEGVTIDCQGADRGIYAANVKNQTVLRDVNLADTTVAAAEYTGDVFYHYWDTVSLHKSHTGDGLVVSTGDGPVTQWSLDDLQVSLGGTGSGIGVHCQGQSRMSFKDPTVENTGQQAMLLAGGVYTLQHPYIESVAVDMTTPVGIEGSCRNITIQGGLYAGKTTGMRQVYINSGVDGGLIGGQFMGTEPDYHVLSDSTDWKVFEPTAVSNASTSNFDARSYANPTVSTSETLSFGSWYNFPDNSGGFLIVDLTARTDGSSPGIIDAEIDQSGGTTADYTHRQLYVDDALASSEVVMNETVNVWVPPGGSVRLVNTGDPTGANSINHSRELLM